MTRTHTVETQAPGATVTIVTVERASDVVGIVRDASGLGLARTLGYPPGCHRAARAEAVRIAALRGWAVAS